MNEQNTQTPVTEHGELFQKLPPEQMTDNVQSDSIESILGEPHQPNQPPISQAQVFVHQDTMTPEESNFIASNSMPWVRETNVAGVTEQATTQQSDSGLVTEKNTTLATKAPETVSEQEFNSPTNNSDSVVQTVTTNTVSTETDNPVTRNDTRNHEVSYFDTIEQLKGELPVINGFEPMSEPVKPEQNKEQNNTPKPEEIIGKAKEIVGKYDKEGADIWTTSSTYGADYVPPSKPVSFDSNHPPLSNEQKITRDVTVEMINDLGNSIPLPPDNKENVMRFVIGNPSIFDDTTGAVKLTSLTEAIENSSSEEMYKTQAINDPETDLRRGYVMHGSDEAISSRRSIMKNEGGSATGVLARSIIADSLGLNSFRTVILPHSGIAAVISAPLVHELVNLQTQIDSAKISIGRSYGGSNYGAVTWFTGNKLVEMFISKIEYCNVKNHTPELLKKLISVLDIPTIAWELACAMYPEGYKYNRVVLNENGTTELVVGNIWLEDCQFMLNNRLSLRQKQHLAKSRTSVSSIEEVESYQRNWLKKEDVPVNEYLIFSRTATEMGAKVKKETYIQLSDCSIEKFANHGSSWDMFVSNATNDVLTLGADEAVRSEFIARKINATLLRDVSHFISRIVVRNTYLETGDVVETFIDEPDYIIDMLDNIGNNLELVNKINEIIVKYINDQTKIVYGVPVANNSEPTAAQSSAIVPINPVVVFFSLTGRIYLSLGS